MFVCIECGHVFNEEGASVWTESRGEYWGSPCHEEMDGCPKCGGSYAQTYECDCCGEWIVDKYIKTEDGCRYCSECYFEHDLGDEDN